MPIHQIPSMPLSEFFKLRTEFEKAARARVPERLEHQAMDIPHGEQVLEEMVMHLIQRVDELSKEVAEFRALLGQE